MFSRFYRLPSDDVIEALFVKLDFGVIAGVEHRPPSSLVKSFLVKFEAVLTVLSNGHSDRIIVVGDFNIDLAGDAQNNYTLLLESFNLRNLITEPTHITCTSSTLIDHALCNIDTDVYAGVHPSFIADHLHIFLVLQKKMINKRSCRPEQRTKIDYAQLRRVLEHLDIYSTYNQNVHIEYYNFVTILKSAITLSAVKKTSNKYNPPVCPWITSDILGVLKDKTT